MLTHEEQMEGRLTSVMEVFKKEMREAVDKTLTEVHCELLPHVLSDAEANQSNMITDLMEKIIEGKFTTESKADGSDFLMVVQDCKGWNHYIRDVGYNVWPSMVQKIYDTATKEIENTRIQQLEAKVESLQQSLAESYRR